MKNIKVVAMSVWIVLVVSTFVLAQVPVVDAPTPAEVAWKNAIYDYVIPTIAAAIGSAIILGITKLLQLIGLKINADQTAKLEKAAESAVQYAAEKAAAYLKVEKVPMPSNVTLNTAIAAMLVKVPKVTAEQADIQIHAALARMKGVGATGDGTCKVPIV